MVPAAGAEAKGVRSGALPNAAAPSSSSAPSSASAAPAAKRRRKQQPRTQDAQEREGTICTLSGLSRTAGVSAKDPSFEAKQPWVEAVTDSLAPWLLDLKSEPLA